ncbi:hypothetical protein BG004_006094, partial [Podila humilis]
QQQHQQQQQLRQKQSVVSGHAESDYHDTDRTQSTAPTGLSMASISNYIDSVKHLQYRSATTITARYQRVPSSSSSQQQQHQSPQYMSLPPLAGLKDSTLTTPVLSASPFLMHYTSSHHHYNSQANVESMHRKRSANLAFDEPVDRSPCSRTGPGPAHAGFIPTHKRFSSASSVTMLMGSATLGHSQSHSHSQGMFSASHLPMEPMSHRRQPHQPHLSQHSLTSSHRSNRDGPMSGSLTKDYPHSQQHSHPYSASHNQNLHHHHQRSASGSFYMELASPCGSSFGQEVSASHKGLSIMARSSGTIHPLDTSESTCSFSHPHISHAHLYQQARPTSAQEHVLIAYPHPQPSSSSVSSSSLVTPDSTLSVATLPSQTGLLPPSSRSSTRSQMYYPSTPPQYSPIKHEQQQQQQQQRSSSSSSSLYEMDPRLWAPLDSISLYAITTQAAKRVVAQSKALSSSANGLHMYYPTLA